MKKKLKDLRAGIRLNIKKPPKIEPPKNIYNRKVKYKKGLDDEKFRPFFIPAILISFYSNFSLLLEALSLDMHDTGYDRIYPNARILPKFWHLL